MQLPSRFLIPAVLTFSSLAFMTTPAPAREVRWYNGVKAPMPQGALLTNNPGYWGEMIPTGVTYSYPEAPSNPADILKRDTGKFGNRLLDGQPGGDWHSPVGMNHKPLEVDFDFHQTITLNQIAVAEYRGQDLKLAEVEVKGETGEWKKVYSATSSKGPLHQMVLPEPQQARQIRIRLHSDANTTYVSQVWMWGEAKPVETKTGANGFLPELQDFPETKNAQPGDGTILSPQALAQWRQATGYTSQEVTWQTAAGHWQMQKKDALKGQFLPGKAALRQPVELTTTRRESESATLFLVNPGDRPQERTVELSSFRDAQGREAATVKGELSVVGAMWTRRWGHTLRPLFTTENKLGATQMQKYLTNGAVIKDFPKLHLPARGTALLWLNVHVNNATPGTYTATVKDGNNTIPVRLTVQPQTLPEPEVWLRFWGNAPASTRNLWSTDEAIRNEVGYLHSLGATVWQTWPEPGSFSGIAREAAAKQGKRNFYVIGVNPLIRDAGYTGKLDPDKFDEAFKKQVHDETLAMVEKAKSLGLDYDDWSVELWDEPTPHNMKSWAAVARLIKEADPQVLIYMNPLFWTREGTNPAGFVNDERQLQSLDGWYNELVDISVPILGQTNRVKYPATNQRFYNHEPRRVRAYFTHPNPGRMLAWDAFVRGYNGWGSYAYFAPRRDAWNDFDDREIDYQIVYPGPNGFIPTIESESMRESWDDYRLLTLLERQGKTELLAQLKHDYENGVPSIPAEETTSDRDKRSAQADKSLSAMRERMMKAIAQ